MAPQLYILIQQETLTRPAVFRHSMQTQQEPATRQADIMPSTATAQDLKIRQSAPLRLDTIQQEMIIRPTVLPLFIPTVALQTPHVECRRFIRTRATPT